MIHYRGLRPNSINKFLWFIRISTFFTFIQSNGYSQISVAPSSLNNFTYCLGNGPSQVQEILFSGQNLTGFPDSLHITGSENLEISINDTLFQTDVLISFTGSSLANSIVYVRFKEGLALGSYTNEFLTVSGGGDSISIPVNGKVTPPFSKGNLVVLRVGTGIGPLSNSATPIFADEYDANGNPTTSVPFPTSTRAGVNRTSITGVSIAEGKLNLSSNGQYLLAGGYDAFPGQTSPSLGTNKVISSMKKLGNVKSSLFPSTFHGSTFRSVTSDDGRRYWTAGVTNGILYHIQQETSNPATPTPISNFNSNNLRFIKIFNCQLYCNSMKQLLKTLNPLPSTSSNCLLVDTLSDGYEFEFIKRSCKDWNLYVANGTYKSILKFSSENNGEDWTPKGSISTDESVFGLVARENTGTVEVFFTTPSSLYKISDTASFNDIFSGPLVLLSQAPLNTCFRGLAFSPAQTGLLTSAESISGFGYFIGNPSLAKTLKISGSELNSPIELFSTEYFEISKDDSLYSQSISIIPNSTGEFKDSIFIRLKNDLPSGAYNGLISISASEAYSKSVCLFGSVEIISKELPKAPSKINPTIFPVPSEQGVNIQISLNGVSDQTVKIEISDLFGRILIDEVLLLKNGRISEEINTSNFPSGIFTCKTTINGESTLQKIVIQ